MPLQILTDVPPLPANYASRAGLSDSVVKSLQKCLKASGLCLVHGAGGMGKTVATCAALLDETTLCETFPQGAAYVTVGQSPDVLSLQSTLLRAFGVHDPPADVSDGYARLYNVLSGCKVLVVLDDVWNASHLECFVPMRGRPKTWSNVAVLVTTRFADLVQKAELLRLGDLTDAESRELLHLKGDGALLTRLAKLCSRSPLALSILGATGQLEAERDASQKPATVFTAFCDELAAQEKAEPNAIKRCIGLAHKRLEQQDKDLYLGMAVFPDDVLLPIAALRTIFRDKDLDTQLPRLERLHLIRKEEGAADGPRIRLHDLSLEFVKEQAPRCGGETALHQELLTNYSSCLEAPQRWWTGPDDGYYYQRLLHHLAASGRIDEARGLLLRWEWLAARLRRPGDAVSLVADVRAFAPHGSLPQHATSGQGPVGSATSAATVMGSSQQAKARASATRKAAASPATAKAKARPMQKDAAATEEAAQALSVWEALLEVLTLSAHILTEDPSQLAFQVLGRLLGSEAPAGPLADLRAGAQMALKEGVYGLPAGTVPSWRCSACPVSKKSLQGVGGPLARTLQLHKDWVRCVAVNEAGTLLASASNDLSVKVWDLTQDCRMLLELLGHETAVLTVDLKGDLVVSGDKDEVILWSLSDGSILKRRPGFAGNLSVVQFLGEGHVAVATGMDVELVGASTLQGKPTCNHEARVAAIHSSAVPGGSATELLLACGCDDKHAALWKLSSQDAKRKKPTAPEFTAQLITRFLVGEQDVRAVSLSRAGNLLACGNDDGVLRIWSISTGKAGLSCSMLCSAPDMHSDWIHSVSMAHDGSCVACGSDDNSISLFDVSKQRMVGQVRIFSGAFSVALSPDLKSLYSASGDIRLWSVPKIKQSHHLNATGTGKHSSAVTGIAVSLDGCHAVSASSDLTDGKTNGGLQIGLWDCPTGSQTGFFKVGGSIDDDDRPLCASMSPDATMAAIGCDTGKLWVVNLTEPFAAVWVQPEAHTERIYCCEWLELDCLATGSEDGSVACWSVRDKVCTATARPYDSGIRCFAWTQDRQRVMCGCDYQAPRLVSVGEKGSDGHVLAEFKDVVRQELTVITPCSISLSSDDRRAVTTSWDKALRVWELDSGQLLLAVTQVSDWVVKGFGATLAGDIAGLCVSYSWDRQLQLWDFTHVLGKGTEKEAVVVSSQESSERLCSCQCDASLVHMACAPRWREGVRRSLVFADEDGGVHFFEVEIRQAPVQDAQGA